LIVPAYADVSTFKTDKTFYGKTSTITFSGAVEKDDFGDLVTIVIEDPNGNFVKLLQAYPDADDKFQKSIDVSKFYTDAGIYNATAFVTNKTNGIVIDFDIEKQRPVITPPTTPPVSEPKQEENTPVTDTQTSQNSDPSEDTKTIQEKIKERIDAAKKLKESQTKINENLDNKTTNGITSVTNNTEPVDNSDTGETKSDTSQETKTGLDSNLLYVIIGLGGAGTAGVVAYSMKNKPKPKDYSSYFAPIEKTEAAQKPDTQSEDDYALMILKNRLAKGEITIEEFNELKKALKEP
jgi:hypothetical protein